MIEVYKKMYFMEGGLIHLKTLGDTGNSPPRGR